MARLLPKAYNFRFINQVEIAGVASLILDGISPRFSRSHAPERGLQLSEAIL